MIYDNNDKRRIAILGSTGSIGIQALEVVENHPELFEVELLTAGSNAGLLVEQAMKFQPNAVVIADKSRYAEVKNALASTPVKVFAGAEAIGQAVRMESIDMVLAAIVGYAGLMPVISAIQAGKTIALANKETLVVAGDLVTRLARQHGVNILPVDSEHSAIFQCLAGEFHNRIERILLTASGGPFRGWKRHQLEKVTPQQALKHPNWSMGAKITIDSATLMNKGLEMIEAQWLFALSSRQIEVVIHPQSIIHSIVAFEDGSMKAQMGLPDMRLPIQYALAYPKRVKNNFPRFSFLDVNSLTFEAPDTTTFPSLEIARYGMEKGGNTPCIINAANEIAVEAFLNHQIGFLQIMDVVQRCIEKVDFIASPSLEDYKETDRKTRSMAYQFCKTLETIK